MAITTNFDYVASNPDALIGEAVFEGTSLRYFRPLATTNKSDITTLVGTPAILGDASCTFNPQAGRAINKRGLETVVLKYQDAICEEDARLLVQSAGPDDLISANLGEFLAADLLSKLNRTVDARVFISTGSADTATTGIYTAARADSGTIKYSVSGSVTAYSGSQIIDEYNKFYNTLPTGVKVSPEHVTFMPFEDIMLLAQSYYTTNGGQKIVEEVGTGAEAYWVYTLNRRNKIVAANGLTSGQWFLTHTQNLFVGKGQPGSAMIKVGKNGNLDDEIGMSAKFNFGVNYGISADVLTR
jgi:hypothetical protein